MTNIVDGDLVMEIFLWNFPWFFNKENDKFEFTFTDLSFLPLQVYMALTKHPEGSVRELWTIALPLMISSFSMLLMLFVDRILLAHYSTSAMNASVNASTMGWAFIFSGMVMASIAEVFVAQYNGAGLKERLGEPVWQMLWLSLSSFVFFIPLSIWGGAFFFANSPHENLEIDYFKWMLLFGPTYAMYSALCGFFVGQGKTHLVTGLAVVANLVNALFDYVLIFGVEGYIPSLGIEGAAIATSGSSLFQVIVLAVIFLNKKNRTLYKTGNFRIQYPLFLQCVKIGLPGAVFVAVEFFGFAIFYWLMTLMGERYITVAGINQSIILLFFFIPEGISKAVMTISGNFIGAKKYDRIPDVLRSGMLILVSFFALIATFFVYASDFLVKQFLPNASTQFLQDLSNTFSVCLVVMAFYLLFEGLRLLFSGILTAAGDTIFLLFAGCVSVWVFLILPVYLIVVQGGASVEFAALTSLFYSAMATLIYYWRYRVGSWQSKSLITSATPA